MLFRSEPPSPDGSSGDDEELPGEDPEWGRLARDEKAGKWARRLPPEDLGKEDMGEEFSLLPMSQGKYNGTYTPLEVELLERVEELGELGFLSTELPGAGPMEEYGLAGAAGGMLGNTKDLRAMKLDEALGSPAKGKVIEGLEAEHKKMLNYQIGRAHV